MANLDLRNQAVQKIILSVLLAASVLAAFFFTHFLPFGYPNRRERVEALKSEYEKKSTELARARAAVADLPRFEAEYETLHDRWITASELLPADRQLAGLLRRISLAGQQTGVTFLMFKPAAARAESHYTELPIEITVYGAYHHVGSFLAELANMRRIVTVSGVRLATNSRGDGLATTLATLTASAYSLNTGAPAAAPATKGDANDARKES